MNPVLTRLAPLLFGLALAACGEGAPKQAAPPPPAVTVAKPTKQTVTDYDEYVGRFVAVDMVEVRARVSGYLDKVHFKDGEIVKQGDPLFSIDRRPFETSLAQVRATLAQARANLAFTEGDLARASQLVKDRTITEQTFEQRTQAKRVAEASVAAQEAAVRQAELDLQFTELKAPVTGRIGDRRVSEGNLVTGGTGGNTTMLAMIVSIDPIRFEFTFDEGSFLRYERLGAEGMDKASRQTGIEIAVKLIDESEFKHAGRMDFVDNMIERGSGTIRGRALLANPKGTLTPGMFGRVRVPGSSPYEALLIPDNAIGSEQVRKYVLVVDAENTARIKYVTLGQLVGNLRVIKDGLSADDRVVVNGLMRARAGSKVTPQEQGAPPPAPGRRRRASAMKISRFFIDRPIFASVLSIVFILLGGVSFIRLPIAQYPEIAPPVINVTGQYPGANAEVVATTVVAPIEEQINGVENMLYMSSNATADGRFSIAVTFDIGTNLDIAQVQVQNRVGIAQPRLPVDVRQIGVTVTKSSPDLMMVVHLFSPDQSRDSLFISNYATLEVKDQLLRVDGVGSITVFGSRDYAMRVWLDPGRLQSLNMTATDVTQALQAQNIQVASGVLNQPPVEKPGAFQVAVQTLGRLANPEEFSNIIVKQTAGAVVRLKDVATIQLAAQDYSSNSYLGKSPAVALAIFQRPGSNALATADNIVKTMEGISKRFPAGIQHAIVYNPTEFIRQSVNAVIETILEAVLLVVLVIIIFLQTWRAAVIPIVAIPVSLIGTFFFMSIFGFTLNNLSLFGLVLAVGIVVDDAIVVVENVERNIAAGLHAARGGDPQHGRGRHRADRDRAGAMRGVHPLGLHHRHLRAILSPVRADDCGRDHRLVYGLAHALARALRDALEAARSAAPRQMVGGADPRLLPHFQFRFRQVRERLWLDRAQGGALRRDHADRLCGDPRLRPERIPQDADRLHPAARPRHHHRGGAASARLCARAHRCGDAARARHRARSAGRRRTA